MKYKLRSVLIVVVLVLLQTLGRFSSTSLYRSLRDISSTTNVCRRSCLLLFLAVCCYPSSTKATTAPSRWGRPYTTGHTLVYQLLVTFSLAGTRKKKNNNNNNDDDYIALRSLLHRAAPMRQTAAMAVTIVLRR